MKKIIFLLYLIMMLFIANQGISQMSSLSNVDKIAGNWIQMVIDDQGHWGNSDSAYPGIIEQLRYQDKLIGYYCNVDPKGFLVFSLRKELAPVKAWSDNGYFDPQSKGVESVIKTCMNRLIDTIESRFGPIETVGIQDIEPMTEINYKPDWSNIENYVAGTLTKKDRSGGNYQQGDTMINSSWHQNSPYNNNCEYYGCNNTSNGRFLVGCVATAGSQIMRYWCWPPNEYDWVNMADVVTLSSPPEQQAAVAILCHDVGVAVDMDYGCVSSSAYTADMVGVFVDEYGYNSECTVKYREDYSATDWFELMKFNLNRNRPIQYRIPGHSIVCDGWRLFGSLQTKQYHMNYGWASSGDDIWYTLDALQGGDPGEEYIIHRTYPAPSLGYSLSGSYVPIPVYRYFDQDAAGVNATFLSGHKLQTLPGIKVFGNGTSSYLKFYGSTGLPTLIFTRGDQSKGIKIQNGAIRFKNNGGFRLQ